MAYTIPGADNILWMLIKPKRGVKMNLGLEMWFKVLPEDQKPFKISDVLIKHKIENKYYLKYMLDQIDSASGVEEFAKDVEKICKWCGDDDIICVPHAYNHFDYILTASLNKNDAVGHVNHYKMMLHVKLSNLLSKWRLWKLTHFRQKKKSAKRQNFILEGTAHQEEAMNSLINYANAIGAPVDRQNQETEGEQR